MSFWNGQRSRSRGWLSLWCPQQPFKRGALRPPAGTAVVIGGRHKRAAAAAGGGATTAEGVEMGACCTLAAEATNRRSSASLAGAATAFGAAPRARRSRSARAALCVLSASVLFGRNTGSTPTGSCCNAAETRALYVQVKAIQSSCVHGARLSPRTAKNSACSSRVSTGVLKSRINSAARLARGLLLQLKRAPPDAPPPDMAGSTIAATTGASASGRCGRALSTTCAARAGAGAAGSAERGCVGVSVKTGAVVDGGADSNAKRCGCT